LFTLSSQLTTVFAFNKKGNIAKAVSIPDLTDLFIPLDLEDIIVSLGSDDGVTTSQFEDVITSLNTMYPKVIGMSTNDARTQVSTMQEGGPALGPALCVAAHILTTLPGEIIVTCSTLPGGIGVDRQTGRLDYRADVRILETDGEAQLLRPLALPKVVEDEAEPVPDVNASDKAKKAYKEKKAKQLKDKKAQEVADKSDAKEKLSKGPPPWLNRPPADEKILEGEGGVRDKSFYDMIAQRLAKMGVFVNVLTFGGTLYIDLASLEVLSSLTGGQLFALEEDSNECDSNLPTILETIIHEPFGDNVVYDATIRLRVQKGLKISEIQGPGWITTKTGVPSHLNFVPGSKSPLFSDGPLGGDERREILNCGKAVATIPVLRR
jgi:hypothetical protein